MQKTTMDGVEQFKHIFITECFELLADMENRLLSLKEEEADPEELNAIFRCAHSIKGGAGAFGYDAITRFTHVLETLLDAMREGKIAPERAVTNTLLKSVDIVTQLVRAAEADVIPPSDTGQNVLAELEAISSRAYTSTHPNAGSSPTATPAEKPTPIIIQEETHFYHIRFIPHSELFLSGNEPLLIIRELETLGFLEAEAIIDSIPHLSLLNPQLCAIGWEFTLESTRPLADVKSVFEFVEDICTLTITEEGGFQPVSVPEAHAVVTTAPAPVPSASTPIAESPALPTAAAEKVPSRAPASSGSNAKPAASPAVSSIRVDIDKVDRLVNMVGELVITQSMLYAQAKHLPVEQFPGLLRGIDELSQHSRELQEAVMAVRMQPVKSIFSRMPRIVRDLCGQLGKEIRLETSGEATEVDKTVIEQLSDPLTHMIRNSVDHGIESPASRLQNGKNAQGVIHLSASHQGGRIVIEITDDGAGINRERVLAKAKEKNLIARDAQLSSEEIDNLIFLPGFSTAETVSNISGRGVGMDVVKRNIESLGGTIKISSTAGKGSRFTVSLPLTLAILDGMIVRVGRENYIIPIANIIETLRPKPSEVRPIAGNNAVINVRGEFVSVLFLHELLDIDGAATQPHKALVVLVENGREKFGLVVDELLGQQQVVIKSLEANADPVEGISGATILGDGKVSLILDISQLYNFTNFVEKQKIAAYA